MTHSEKDMIDRLARNMENLSPWEKHFVLDTRSFRTYKPLSENQRKTLGTIFQERVASKFKAFKKAPDTPQTAK
jgi:hypothetical protein